MESIKNWLFLCISNVSLVCLYAQNYIFFKILALKKPRIFGVFLKSISLILSLC